MHKIDVIDSHTGGEPTRVVIAGFPDLGGGSLAERRERFRREFDHWRSAIACEPRGSDTMVGALLVPAVDKDACTGVIFFNNVGYLGMCGHGSIGVIRTLAHLGRIAPGLHKLETPVGTVGVELHEDGRVSIDNVESYRHAAGVRVEVPSFGTVTGDVAWGGNWFFITEDTPVPLDFAHVRELTAYTEHVRLALEANRITGADGAEIDHIEVNAAAPTAAADARNFVLCPGLAYDRSPCGTGTSAKIACLAADGKLAPDATWRQESILGSLFEARYTSSARGVLPRITGSAHITAQSTLYIDPADPFAWGVGAATGDAKA
ncbi:MAG: 4-hydroxyproline epimerase [Rudaea sp.]|uniref:4-hydroxyproline epimerase n=1 Tax=unclassified Rudaea TaxID=2627037 RepID=UPI0010F49BA8|nr:MULTISPECIES: 4-hydroxyproline epimerase [unclassified Rudaea]MBN8887822.1 4-hydroxyproline epimerase [Rudaea sp.]MBR0346593.1 4-hydroxyproline epimerase [Rudaea sp.]